MKKEIRKVKITMDGTKADSCIFKGNISLFVITFFAMLFLGGLQYPFSKSARMPLFISL